jgi:hypothetical protein
LKFGDIKNKNLGGENVILRIIWAFKNKKGKHGGLGPSHHVVLPVSISIKKTLSTR